MSDDIKKLDEDDANQLQRALFDELLKRIVGGTASSADLNVARQMLKDSNITISLADDSKGSPVDRMRAFGLVPFRAAEGAD